MDAVWGSALLQAGIQPSRQAQSKLCLLQRGDWPGADMLYRNDSQAFLHLFVQRHPRHLRGRVGVVTARTARHLDDATLF
jgi:hypothetical protein